MLRVDPPSAIFKRIQQGANVTAIKISAAAAAMVVALSGAAFAQTGMPESHGTNAGPCEAV